MTGDYIKEVVIVKENIFSVRCTACHNRSDRRLDIIKISYEKSVLASVAGLRKCQAIENHIAFATDSYAKESIY